MTLQPLLAQNFAHHLLPSLLHLSVSFKKHIAIIICHCTYAYLIRQVWAIYILLHQLSTKYSATKVAVKTVSTKKQCSLHRKYWGALQKVNNTISLYEGAVMFRMTFLNGEHLMIVLRQWNDSPCCLITSKTEMYLWNIDVLLWKITFVFFL